MCWHANRPSVKGICGFSEMFSGMRRWPPSKGFPVPGFTDMYGTYVWNICVEHMILNVLEILSEHARIGLINRLGEMRR